MQWDTPDQLMAYRGAGWIRCGSNRPATQQCRIWLNSRGLWDVEWRTPCIPDEPHSGAMHRDMDCHEALYFLNSLNAEPNAPRQPRRDSGVGLDAVVGNSE